MDQVLRRDTRFGISIRHTERARLLDPSTILLRSPACILSNGASGVPLATSAIFSSNWTNRFPIFSAASIMLLANCRAERAFLKTDPAAASWPRSCRSCSTSRLHGVSHILRRLFQLAAGDREYTVISISRGSTLAKMLELVEFGGINLCVMLVSGFAWLADFMNLFLFAHSGVVLLVIEIIYQNIDLRSPRF